MKKREKEWNIYLLDLIDVYLVLTLCDLLNLFFNVYIANILKMNFRFINRDGIDFADAQSMQPIQVTI